jgi:ribosomal protein S18 acetylase RimI-like enzyme
MEIEIQYADRDEIPEIAALIDSAWKTTYREILSPEYLDSMLVEERSEEFFSRFDRGECRFFIIRDSGGIVGVAVFGKSITEGYPNDGEVSEIYLRPDSIGKGYGNALFEKAEKALMDMGYTDFILDVFTENHRAIDFYTARGYEKIEDRLLDLDGVEYPYILLRKSL